MSVAPGAMVGPYRLERVLGRGGMAVVYEATHESMGRTVALKLVSPDLTDPGFVERFRNEGRMQAALEHPHVVTVFEAGTSEYGPYLAMRLIRGTTLAELIENGSLTAARTLHLLTQIAGALDAAHAAGLVHRDVKPRNVLVDGETAYLADFGLTKLGAASGVTATGQFMGTLAYVAPEIIQGAGAGPPSDRYALAAVLFECLSGSPVFPRESQAAVLYAHTNEPAPEVSRRRPDLPAALDDVLIAGLAKDPRDRPSTAVELLHRAQAVLGGLDVAAPVRSAPAETATAAATSEAPVVRPAPAAPRSRLPLVLAAMAGAVVIALVAVLLTVGGKEESAAALPVAPAHTTPLGSDLAAVGKTVDCRGEAVEPASPSCTIFQEQLEDTMLVVPERGVIRRWAVRGASGEVALAVLRPRDGGYFQISRSRQEFASNAGVSVFDANLAVEASDRLGLVVIDGSGIGLGPSGTTSRWTPILSGTSQAPEAGPAGELLLHADLEPRGHIERPELLLGAEAAGAPAGEEIRNNTVPYGDTDALVEVVLVDGRGVLDLTLNGERVARIDIPDMREPLSGIVDLALTRTGSESLVIDIDFARPSSARLLHHSFDARGERLVFIE